MQIDVATLADLELGQTGKYASPLITLLDNTRTRGGASALQELLRSPLSTVADIRARQALLRAIDPAFWSAQLRDLDVLIQRVDSYLGSSFVLMPRSGFATWMTARRYPEIVENLEEGLRATSDLLQFAFSLSGTIAKLGAEVTEADETLGAIHRCATESVLFELGSKSSVYRIGQSSLAKFDSRVRGDVRIADLLRELIRGLHQFDALQSLAAVSLRPGFTYPDVTSSERPFVRMRG